MNKLDEISKTFVIVFVTAVITYFLTIIAIMEPIIK